jgi:enoyl-CoA hydratase/carnithine racemase
MNYKNLEFERRGAIGTLTFNRPERLNAFSRELIDELNHLLTSLMDDLQARVVIIQGKGMAFSAGADLDYLDRAVSNKHKLGKVQHYYHNWQQKASDMILLMRRLPQPLIAAVRGAAAGGGFAIALACDVIIAGESACFNGAFIRIGLSGCDVGSSYLLPRRIGFSRAAEYLYTGRFMDAATAYRVGLVSRVVPDEQVEASAIELAEEMLRNSPFGLRMTKAVLNQNIDAPSLESAIELENRTQALCILTEDAKEGRRAFMEKRTAVYHDR